MRDEIRGRKSRLDKVIVAGNDLINTGHTASNQIEQKIIDLQAKIKHLENLALDRANNIEQHKCLYQVYIYFIFLYYCFKLTLSL